jgi:hypothetical protein
MHVNIGLRRCAIVRADGGSIPAIAIQSERVPTPSLTLAIVPSVAGTVCVFFLSSSWLDLIVLGIRIGRFELLKKKQ